jgi:hypothetical protein
MSGATASVLRLWRVPVATLHPRPSLQAALAWCAASILGHLHSQGLYVGMPELFKIHMTHNPELSIVQHLRTRICTACGTAVQASLTVHQPHPVHVSAAVKATSCCESAVQGVSAPSIPQNKMLERFSGLGRWETGRCGAAQACSSLAWQRVPAWFVVKSYPTRCWELPGGLLKMMQQGDGSCDAGNTISAYWCAWHQSQWFERCAGLVMMCLSAVLHWNAGLLLLRATA